MKKYQSFKMVEAAKVLAVDIVATVGEEDKYELLLGFSLQAEDKESLMVSREWYLKHSDNDLKKLIGGYFVRYEDGYESWSPAEAFEGGYREVTGTE